MMTSSIRKSNVMEIWYILIHRKHANGKTARTSETDEQASTTTRSMKGFDDYPTFAVNPAFSSKPPSIISGPHGVLPSQSVQMFSNPTYSGGKSQMA